jgi:DNA-binding CsgD family transcriptional regulator
MAAAIRVCIALSDPDLAKRMVSLLSGDGGFETIFDDDGTADVILTDYVEASSAPSILIDDDMTGAVAADADIRAVLPSTVNAELLRAAIIVVSAGLSIAPPDEPSLAFEGEPGLTLREGEVLSLLAQGASNKSIARALGISVHTAKFHVASLSAKLGARNRSDAVAIGMRRGMVLI